MVKASKLDALKQRFAKIELDPNLFHSEPLPKMASLIESLAASPSSPVRSERWQQDDLYSLYHLPVANHADVRKQLAVYQRINIKIENNNRVVNAQEYYLHHAKSAEALLKHLTTTGFTDPEKLKAVQKSQMKFIYLIFAAIKNFLLLQELRAKTLTSGIGQNPNVVVEEAHSITHDIVSVQQAMLEMAGYASSRLDSLEHDSSGSELLEEIKTDFECVQRQVLSSLLKKSIFSDISASSLQSTFTDMQMDFGDEISKADNRSGLFFYISCLPCIPNPLKAANRKLQEMKLVVLDGTEEPAWAVLGLFLEAHQQAEGYPEFTDLIEKCFQDALHLPISECDQVVKNIAEARLAAYRQSQVAPSDSILKERQLRHLGYQRLNT